MNLRRKATREFFLDLFGGFGVFAIIFGLLALSCVEGFLWGVDQ